jgi:hypothetical protein
VHQIQSVITEVSILTVLQVVHMGPGHHDHTCKRTYSTDKIPLTFYNIMLSMQMILPTEIHGLYGSSF